MKKNNMCRIFMIVMVFMGIMTENCLLVAQNDSVQEKKVQKRKSTKASRRQTIREEVPVEQAPQEEVIENFDAYIREFDHAAKEKASEALLVRAIDYCKNNSLEKICHAFTHTQDFVEGALYIFLIDTKGVVYAHGDQANLLWKNLWNKHDMFGAPIIQSMIKLAREGGGKLTYEWDGAVKVSSIQSVTIGGKEFVIGCGYYPHSKEYAAVGLVKGAVALFNRHMAEKRTVQGSFSDMSYPLSPQFVFGDLYLYALDFNGTILAQGDRPGLIGSPALDYTDASGKAYNREIITMLKDKNYGEGIWVEYISKRAKKRAYAEKVKDTKGNNYFIACGYYPDITRDTTVDLVRRGYQFMKASGVSAAIKEFTNEQEEPYRYGDLALFIFDMKGTCLANGKNKDLMGQNMFNAKDEDGRYFVREMINQARLGGGWVSFKINHSFQSTYVERIDMGVGEFIIGCGMFPISKADTMELLVKSGLAYLNGHTMEQLLERLVDRNDEFLRGDLFMYVFDIDGFCYGWADSYKLIWQNLINWKDDNGKPFVKEMIDASKQGPEHLVLKMNKCPRVNYFEQVEKDGKKYIVGSGFYK